MPAEDLSLLSVTGPLRFELIEISHMPGGNGGGGGPLPITTPFGHVAADIALRKYLASGALHSRSKAKMILRRGSPGGKRRSRAVEQLVMKPWKVAAHPGEHVFGARPAAQRHAEGTVDHSHESDRSSALPQAQISSPTVAVGAGWAAADAIDLLRVLVELVPRTGRGSWRVQPLRHELALL
eukprot:COSAG01_NODE_2295_length_7967_cov_3.577021_4_plen_182_part_00